MALSAYNILNARKVIFLPSYQVNDGTSFLDRFRMIKSGIEDYGLENEKFSISSYFHKDDSMADLVAYFKRKFPDDRLIILLGEDQLNDFFSQKGIDKVSYLSSVYYVPRDGSFDSGLERKYLIHKLPLYKMPMNSAEIRLGKELYTTEKVLNYIGENRLYFCKDIAAHMKESRYLHSLSVAKTAYKIAYHNPALEIEPYLAFQAGIFHDCGKDLPVEEQRKIVNIYFPSYLPCPDFALHQFVGKYIAETHFGIDKEEILSSIMYHCTGRMEMTELEKLIYAADKVEPTRQFETRKCRLACYDNLDKGFIKTIMDQKRYFEKNGIPFMEHELSRQMYEGYLKEEK